jgi:dihydroorotase
MLIRGGRLVDPAQDIDQESDVLIEDGVVAATGPSLGADGAEVIDAGGLVVSPGLVDMHVHLREPGREDEETIASGATAAIAGGFTSIACMPNTEPAIEGEKGVEFVLSKAEEVGMARVYVIAAASRGLKGKTLAEIGSAIGAGAVGVTDDGMPLANGGLMRRALEYVKMFGRPVISHSEDPTLSAGGVMNEGRMSTLLGLKGIPGASESAAVARDILLTELTGSRLHVCHVSAARSLGFIEEAKRRGIGVTCEVTPHHLTLSDEAVRTYDTNAKMNPPLRDERDVGALRHAVKTGLVDAIASDHAPHSEEEKDQEFDLAPFGIIGLETSLGLMCTHLYHQGIVSLPGLLRLMSTSPAAILGIPAGSLQVGRPADVTLLDPEAEWTVDASEFKSLSRNTPFSGWKLKGRAVSVLIGGEWMMREGEIT